MSDEQTCIERLRKWAHDKWGWHRPNAALGFDGCSMTSRCMYCNLRILQDSQGGWFLAWRQDDE
jgi:hypothetical protein